MKITTFQMLQLAWEKSHMIFNLETKPQRDGEILKQPKRPIEITSMIQQTNMLMKMTTFQMLLLELIKNMNFN